MDKITPTEERQQLMRFMMEQFGQINNSFKKTKEEISGKIDQNNEKIDKMEEKINENSKRQIEILREDIETLNNKIEGNNETLKQQINEKMEEHSDTSVSYTHLDVYKRQAITGVTSSEPHNT